MRDCRTLVAAHQRHCCLGTEDVAHQVDVEDRVPDGRARLVYLLVFAGVRVDDGDTEAPELLRGTLTTLRHPASEPRSARVKTNLALTARPTNRTTGGR